MKLGVELTKIQETLENLLEERKKKKSSRLLKLKSVQVQWRMREEEFSLVGDLSFVLGKCKNLLLDQTPSKNLKEGFHHQQESFFDFA